MRHLVLLLVFCGLISCSGPAAVEVKKPSVPVAVDANLPPRDRLGDVTRPLEYQVRLEIDPRAPGFFGSVDIEVQIERPVDTLWLHQKNLKIQAARLGQGGREWSLAVIDGGDPELLGLRADTPAVAGRASLHIEYSGTFGHTSGLFRQAHEGEWYAYTDFEAIDARSAIPCFDEPRFKVPWTIELAVPREFVGFANTPQVAETEAKGGSKILRFAKTRPLPSYLVALAAGPFDVLESKTSKIPMRIIAPRGEAEKGQFVLDHTPTWLGYLEDYFGMEMPYPKIDFIAVPRFGGAMENPGLITVASRILLVDPRVDDDVRIRSTAGVIAHELAHLWFGDLVTMSYWNDLWLNEGFATWMSDKVVAAWQPQQARRVLDIADKSTAYQADGSPDPRAVRQPIEKREDIAAAFDAITYRKGGAVLAMFEAWLGEAVVRRGVRDYLAGHIDGNAESEDFVRALNRASGKQLEQAFASFLDQPGIPVVAATMQCQGKPALRLEQSSYQPLGAPPVHPQGKRWQIPVCFRYPVGDAEKRRCVLLTDKVATIALESEACPAWVHPNDAEAGYYHYELGDREWLALAQGAALDPREQAGLAINASAALRSGHLSLDVALEVLGTLPDENNRHADEVIANVLELLARSVIGEGETRAFRRLVADLYGERANRLGVVPRPGEAGDDAIRRRMLLELVGGLADDRKLRKQVRAQLGQWLERSTAVEPELLSVWLHLAAIDGDEALFERYVELASKESDGERRFALTTAQLSFRKPALLLRAMDALRRRNLSLLSLETLADAVADPAVGEHMLAYLREHREAIWAAASEEMRSYLPLVFSRLCTAEALGTMAEFADSSTPGLAWASYSVESCEAFARHHRVAAARRFAPRSR